MRRSKAHQSEEMTGQRPSASCLGLLLALLLAAPSTGAFAQTSPAPAGEGAAGAPATEAASEGGGDDAVGSPAPAAPAPELVETLPAAEKESLPPGAVEAGDVPAGQVTQPGPRNRGGRIFNDDLTEISPAQWQEEYRYLNQLIQRFDRGVVEFNSDVQNAIDQKYEEELSRHQDNYDALLEKMREEVTVRRGEAIARYEQFLQRYPNSSKSAIAMVRLAELYYEEAQIQFFAEEAEYDRLFEAKNKGEISELPPEPKLDYERSLALYNQVLERFPDYKNIDGVHYVRGFIYNKSDATTYDPDAARDAFFALIETRPNSPHAFQAYMLIGDYYFEQNELEQSIAYYQKAMEFRDKPWDLALYKLAWARYRSGQYQEAINRFVELLDYSDDLKARTGRESQQRTEAVQYLAISFADYGALSEDVNFGFNDAVAFFEEIGGRPYQLEILKRLAEVYQQLARFEDAVFAYNRLQELYPDNPDNPTFQREVVNIYIGLPYGSDVDSAIAAQKALVERYGSDSAWYAQMNADLNKKAATYSQKQVQEALKDIAFFHHQQALNPETPVASRAQYYDEASEYYREYLARFPFTQDAFELQYYYADCLFNTGRMEEAAREYKKALTYTNTKYHATAAQGVIFALAAIIAQENLQAGLTEPFPQAEPKEDTAPDGEVVAPKPVEMHPLLENYLAAVDTYVRIDRDAEDTPRFMFLAGRSFYFHNQFDEARRRFDELINLYPGDEQSVQAALLTVDSYNREGNWDAVVQSVDAFVAMELGPDPTNWRTQRDLLVEIQSNAVFQIALRGFVVPEGMEPEEIQAGKADAAKAFLAYVDRYPDADNRAGALANAALAWEQAGNTDEAIAVRKRLIREHPESEFVEKSYYFIASNYEKAFDFKQAIEYHEELAANFPDSKNAPISLFNAAFLKLGLRQYEDAAKGFESYVRLYPGRDDAESVLFMAGETWEKAEQWAQAVRVYRDYVRAFPASNGDRVVLAYYRTIEDLNRLGRTREAIDAEKRLASIYEGLKEGGLLSLRGLNLYASVRFREVERQFEAFNEIGLKGSESQLGRQLDRKNKAQEELARLATEVGKLGDQEYRLASLYYVARTYQSYAKAAEEVPVPAGFDEIEQEVYREEVRENFVYPNEETAIKLYEAIVQQSEDLKISNRWTDKARDQLNILQPDAYPIRKPERTRGLPADKDFAAPPTKTVDGDSQASL